MRRTVEVQTFIPSYPPMEKRQRATKSTTLRSGEEFDYRRMRIRADLIERLEAMKPEDKTLTAFLNTAIASFLNTCKWHRWTASTKGYFLSFASVWPLTVMRWAPIPPGFRQVFQTTKSSLTRQLNEQRNRSVKLLLTSGLHHHY